MKGEGGDNLDEHGSADGPGLLTPASDEQVVAGSEAAPLTGVIGQGERLDQRALVKAHVVGQSASIETPVGTGYKQNSEEVASLTIIFIDKVPIVPD